MNIKAKNNIPKLRFLEFSGDWHGKRIGDVLKVGSGRDYKHLSAGNIPVYGTGGYMKSVDEYLYDGESVCIGRKGTIDKPVYLNEKFWTVDTLFYTHSFKDSVPKFIYAIFQSINWKQHNEASGVPSLSKATIEKIKIEIPQPKEQQKIASFLSSVDERLSQLGEKKKLLEQYKKGMMQKLFTQQISFKDGNGNDYQDWEEKRLEDILFEHKTTNHTNNISEVFSVSKHKGVINQIEHLGRSYAADSISHYKVANPFDVIYTKSPTSEFPFGIIKQNLTERSGVVSPLYAVFRPLNQHVGYILHTHFLSWVNTYNYLNPLVQKGAKNTMSIRNDDFLNGAKINFPNSTEEQTKIANFLASLDNKINLVTAELIQAQTFKKGLLQQMFI